MEVATINPNRSDADKARDYRAELAPLLQQTCDIIDRARRDGIILSFNLTVDQFGKQQVGGIGAVRPL